MVASSPSSVCFVLEGYELRNEMQQTVELCQSVESQFTAAGPQQVTHQDELCHSVESQFTAAGPHQVIRMNCVRVLNLNSQQQDHSRSSGC